ncbi:VTT domain-containing protein [Periweissella beninensis]|uniref:VTT domain-containing protein n=1 Tax=Periweissella beninensis TaxID=504936 RepID=A0ABT0VLR1_9LACO|nr:VTT domain-containing protein [Periweissella beninensis]MBM7544081.1 membrane-associated protein [Periweissella beninensis]MCM2437362.1 VTT domain-containing protein [Periweissella beninensis]MCT4396984.1 cytochrome O ubiquinol oxidase [Periweissella beninensis]
MSFLIDFILHIDDHIVQLVTQFGSWTYIILFFIIFIETGIVIMPFLPGDSLLFAAGAISANAAYGLDPWLFALLFWLAALTGDSLNFLIGRSIGPKLIHNRYIGRFIKQSSLDDAQAFFDKHGAMAIILARYMPIIRTFAPFVAATSGLTYHRFIKYSVIGATSWTLIATGAGYFFGNIPFIKAHFSGVLLGIIGVTLLPIIISTIKSKLQK